ncbi:hypothetical protein C8R45DRAFT_1112557 [Mycena sanguinolenta]|nr:hypothetical protein C8R45DRAFT_1112557 [Mycena sanguinolenta]
MTLRCAAPRLVGSVAADRTRTWQGMHARCNGPAGNHPKNENYDALAAAAVQLRLGYVGDVDVRLINYVVRAAPFILDLRSRRINAASPSMHRRVASRPRRTIPNSMPSPSST